MSFEKLRSYLELLRPLNVLMMMLVIAAAVVLGSGEMTEMFSVLVASLVGGLVGGAANVINDYFDVDIDRINRPHRPLARGVIGKPQAFLLWFLLSAAGISLNLFLNFAALAVAAAAVIILYLYSARLKGTVLFGNVTVAAMTGLAFVYGGVVAGRPELSVVPALFAFLVNLAREIVKDMEDMEGDRQGNAITLPLKYGVKSALTAVTIVVVILIFATLWPYASGLYSSTYLMIVGVVDLLLLIVLIALWKDPLPRTFGRVSLVLKMNMVLGLAALYLGS